MSLPNRYFAAVLFCLTCLCITHTAAIAQPIIGQRLLNRFQGPAPVESANFIVYANDRIMAAKVSQAAEGFRKSLAAQWLGRELPAWRQKCPIHVKIDLHAGGETSFAFQMTGGNNRGVPVDWDMKVFGSPERILGRTKEPARRSSIFPSEVKTTKCYSSSSPPRGEFPSIACTR